MAAAWIIETCVDILMFVLHDGVTVIENVDLRETLQMIDCKIGVELSGGTEVINVSREEFFDVPRSLFVVDAGTVVMTDPKRGILLVFCRKEIKDATGDVAETDPPDNDALATWASPTTTPETGVVARRRLASIQK